VNNSACSASEPSIDFAKEVKSVKCKVCTQASSTKHKYCSGEMLKKTLVTPSGIQAAFCNDEYLVVWTNGRPTHATNLYGVPRPPGGGADGSPYEEQCVTRTFVTQSQTFKIPLNFTLLADGQNNTIPNGAQLPTEVLPMSGAIGVMLDGVPIYPNEDNRGETVQDSCEADRCMAHVGRGFDYHYHGDPFGHTCMYSEDNATDNHPSLIGFGADGILIYGRYTGKKQEGFSEDLDTCGGHVHTTYGYHYHAVVITATHAETGQKYTSAMISPLNCWKGDISKIDNFWMSTSDWSSFLARGGATEHPSVPTQMNYDNSKTNPPMTPTKRNDVEQLRPCCSSTEYYTAEGISLPLSNEEELIV
jgi:hypothetical protein